MLISPARRNPDAPRFVNIGDDIVESGSAKPVAPAGVCAPVAAPPTVVERDVVFVPVPSGDSADVTPISAEPPVTTFTDGIPLFPFVAAFPRRMHPRVHPVLRPQSRVMQPSVVMLPPFPTVLLPPGQTPVRVR